MDSWSIQLLRRQFLCCNPLSSLKWPDCNGFDVDTQKLIIDETVNSELVQKYPIRLSYKKAFLKSFITRLEQSRVEIDDYVYKTYCEAIASPDGQSVMNYRHFLFNLGGEESIVSVKESTSIVSQGTTGLCSWQAAFYLAEWCVANKDRFQGKNVLELGSGVGLTGLTVINFCTPKAYCFSDGHPVVLRTLGENVRLNLLDGRGDLSWKEVLGSNRIQFETIGSIESTKVNAIDLKWEEICDLPEELLDTDFVIAADILYDISLFDSLARGLRFLMLKNVKYAIVAATVRNESTISEFLNILANYDLSYKEEIGLTPRLFVQSEKTEIRILRIFREK